MQNRAARRHLRSSSVALSYHRSPRSMLYLRISAISHQLLSSCPGATRCAGSSLAAPQLIRQAPLAPWRHRHTPVPALQDMSYHFLSFSHPLSGSSCASVAHSLLSPAFCFLACRFTIAGRPMPKHPGSRYPLHSSRALFPECSPISTSRL